MLERGGVAVVVLGRDDDEGVGPADVVDEGGHRVIAFGRVGRGQVGIGQVEESHVHVVSRSGLPHEPLGDDRAEPAFAGAAEDDDHVEEDLLS